MILTYLYKLYVIKREQRIINHNRLKISLSNVKILNQDMNNLAFIDKQLVCTLILLKTE